MIEKNKKKEKEKEELDRIKQEADQSRSLAESYLDQLRRLKAEFENYRKRMLKESEIKFKSGEKTLAKGLLYVIDNLQRALESEHIDREGIELIYKEFYNILKARGLEKMNDHGKQFDPNYHHALSFVPSSETEDGKIVEVIQPGYFWDKEVLRPAQVVVAKAQEDKKGGQ